ncbi:hypothetical protein EBZ80_17895 [bacterium]|nr:hypothetical protein [bacterium]
MATLRIKRRATGGASGAPSTLAQSELAFSEVDDILHIGKGTGGGASVLAIGGPGAFLSLTATQTASGTYTFSGTVNLSGTFKVGGTSVTSTAAELNTLAGVTAGTATASKALIVDANKDISLGTGDLSCTDVTASGNVSGTWNGVSIGVSKGGTGLTTMAKGTVLVANTADTITALDGGGTSNGVLYYTASTDTISWATELDGGSY